MHICLPFMIRRVSGHSMLPVLPPGTLVIGLRWFWRLKPSMVVIFMHDNREVIKRIAQVDGTQLTVLGDHPDASTDSRQYGPVKKHVIQSIVIWPRASSV